MRKTAIMQPYFFPYLGYWQLFDAVDTFVVYDDVNYIKNGWINRNRILLDGRPQYITLALSGSSPFKAINETRICPDAKHTRKILGCVASAYRKAPHFEEIFPVVEKIVLHDADNIADFLCRHFRVLLDLLGLETKLLLSSRLEKDTALRGQDKVLDICGRLHTDMYVNAIGGTGLYSREAFQRRGMELRFLQSAPAPYAQFGGPFVENLSIIDVLMFNGAAATRELLRGYALI